MFIMYKLLCKYDVFSYYIFFVLFRILFSVWTIKHIIIIRLVLWV